MTDFKTHNNILLTGAGFTKNFGGFLADEVWSHIFNDQVIQNSPALRSLLQDNFDFEAVYSDVLTGQYSPEEKAAMSTAVEGAYKLLDDSTRGWVFNSDSPYPVNAYGVGKLLNLFTGQGDTKGFMFTLNQDLFMERQHGFRSPGVPSFANDFYSLRGRELKRDEFVTVPRDDAANKIEQGINNHAGLIYVKLHGSYGWRSTEGNHRMVIGTHKTDLIEQEPLLKWYFDFFKDLIREGNKKLLVIGYGFADMHINKAILDGIQNHGLRLFVVSTRSARSMRDGLLNGHYYAKDIMSGLSGYFPYSLREIFPSDQSDTVHFQRIREAL